MKRLILLMVLLLAGCGVDPRLIVEKQAVVVEKTERSEKMLQGNTLKMKAYKETDIIKTELRNTKIEVDKAYSDYISDGYSIYDISAKGGLTYLSAEAVGKWLCVWKDFEPTYLATPDTGTATAGGATSITLAAGASAVDDYYNGMVVELTGGTGSGQFNIITDYNGTTKVATVGGTWGTNPDNTSVYKIGDYDYITAADVTIHTDVVVLGVKLDAYNISSKFCDNVYIYINAYNNYNDQLYIKYFQYLELKLPITVVSALATKIYFENSNIFIKGAYVPISATDLQLKDCNFKNCYIKLYDLKYQYEARLRFGINTIIENCIFETEGTGAGRFDIIIYNNTLTFNNCIFQHDKNQTFRFKNFSGTPFVDFNNCLFWDTELDFDGIKNDNGGILYFFNSEMSGNSYIANYQIKTVATTNGFIVGKYKIDFTEIDFNTFVDFTADWKHESVVSDNFWTGRQREDYYTALFFDNYLLAETLKKISEGFIFVVKREDFEADLLNATGGAFKIKNFTLYENDGTTLADFQANENFIIKATDGTDTAVFLWMNNILFGTVYGDVWDNTTYTIQQCFQLWEVETFEGVSNTIKKYDEPKAITDSPCSGSVKFNNMDNEIKVRQ